MRRQLLLSFLLAGADCLAQSPPLLPHFDVASVKIAVPKPATPGADGGRRGGGSGGCPPRGTFAMPRGRMDIGCASLAILIGYAFGVPPDRVVGPDWMPGTRFDIAAKLPDGAPQAQVPEMLQALLAERFKLATHRGTREQEICALVVAKGGLKLKQAAAMPDAPETPDAAIAHPGGIQTQVTRIENADGGFTTIMSNARIGTVRRTDGREQAFRWEAPSTTLAGLADLLNGVGPLPDIVDMTGLSGRYEVDLKVSLRDAFAAAAARGSDPAAKEDSGMDVSKAVLKALNEGLLKLGLQVERRKGPVETIVVDHIERTPSGN
jgi:uncharacterized protein (TIGR03435 family)